MAKIPREKIKVFAGGSTTPKDFGVVGSFALDKRTVASSAPPPTEQILEDNSGGGAYDAGLTAIVEDGQLLPTMEEFNSIFYSITRWIKYGAQEGIMEWSPTEIYYPHSIVKHQGRLWKAINSNPNGFIGQAPPVYESPANPPASAYWGRLYFAPNSVDTDTINDRNVTEAKLADSAVSERTIQSNAVTTAKIKNGAVTREKIRDGAVDTDKLADGAVTLDKLAEEVIEKIEEGGGGDGGELPDEVTMDMLSPELRERLDVRPYPDLSSDTSNAGTAPHRIELWANNLTVVGKMATFGAIISLHDPTGFGTADNSIDVFLPDGVLAKGYAQLSQQWYRTFGRVVNNYFQYQQLALTFENAAKIHIRYTAQSVTGAGVLDISVPISITFPIE